MAEFTQNEWIAIGELVADELRRREEAPYRRHLEKAWAEVDRQIAMSPKVRVVQSGQDNDWFPNTELPSQFNALEVIMADARRMMFPRGREWYTVRSELSDDYLERFEKRRERFPLIDGLEAPIRMDQDTADTLVKAAIDHHHWMYDFRGAFDLLHAEAIKYGTYIARIREVTYSKFTTDERGVYSKGAKGPAVIPRSVKNTYLDDLASAVLHEGYGTTPATIGTSWKHLDDLKRAAKQGGSDKGWRTGAVSRLEPVGKETEHRGQIRVAEYEGDIYVPGSKTSRYLPNVRILVALGVSGGPKVIRLETDVNAEMVVGTYIRENVESPYGLSPLMKGAPIQEAASEALNRLMAAAALNAEPHIIYDKNDPGLVGGVDISPGGHTGVEDIESSIRDLNIGDPAALLQVYIALIKQYEDVTGVNDPRKGAQTKSHTTAMAADIEQARGQVRTEDYVVAQQQGPMTQILYKEYEFIKRSMKRQSVAVNAGGIEGWINISAEDLPDRVYMEVHGALGPFDEREKSQMFLATTTTAMQLIGMAKQLGLPAPELDIEEAIRTLYLNAGTNDSNRYVRKPKPPELPAPRSPVGGGAGGTGPGLPEGGPAQVFPAV